MSFMILTSALQPPIAAGFLRLIDYIALFYLVLLLWIPFYWFVFHAAIRFWRRWATARLGGAAGLADICRWPYHPAPHFSRGGWSAMR